MIKTIRGQNRAITIRINCINRPDSAVLFAALTAAIFFFTAFIPLAYAAPLSINNNGFFKVDKYNVTVELIPEKHMISGEVEILTPDGALYIGSGEITLNLHADMDVRQIMLSPGGIQPDYERAENFIKFKPARNFDKIYISFYGDPSKYITPKNSFTYIGPEGCYFDDLCSYFPRAGFDQKSLFDIRIIHNNDWLPVTQGNIIENEVFNGKNESTREERKITRYCISRPSRCHTLAAGPYEKSEYVLRDGILAFPITAFFYRKDKSGAQKHLQEAARIIKFYRDSYGGNLIDQLKIVEIEKVFPGGYGPREVIYITAAAVENGRLDYELLAHEIAHQWFGNFVMGEFPASNFLNEAFATYASLEYIKTHYPQNYQRKFDESRRRYLAYRTAAGGAEISIHEAVQGGRGDYQALVYFRGMMALKNLTGLIANAAGLTEAEIIRKYLEAHAEKIITIDDFKNYIFDEKKGIFSSIKLRDRKAFEAAELLFKKFYYTTGAVELTVKKAYITDIIAGRTPVTRCVMCIERSDSIECDINTAIDFYFCSNETVSSINSGASFITPPENDRLITHNYGKHAGRKNITLKNGSNTFEIELNGAGHKLKYRIDEENIHLITYDIPRFKINRERANDTLAVYESARLANTRVDFYRQLAKKMSPVVISDSQLNIKDFFKYRNIILIGIFNESPAAGIVNFIFNVSGLSNPSSYIGISASKGFNDFIIPKTNNLAARLCVKNPFIKDGIITAFVFDGAAVAEYNKLNAGFDDLCVYDISSGISKTGNFTCGVSGSFSTGRSIEVLYATAGLSGNFIAEHPASVIMNLFNSSDFTEEVEIKLSSPAGNIYGEEKLSLSPLKITRFESRPYIFNRETINYSIKNINGGEIYQNSFTAKAFQPTSPSYAIFASSEDEFYKVSALLDRYNSYSGIYRQKNSANIINAGFGSYPRGLHAYTGYRAIIFYNCLPPPDEPALIEALKSFASTGGGIIISGGDLSGLDYNGAREFMKDIFNAETVSSKFHEFDSGTAAIVISPTTKEFYKFKPACWEEMTPPFLRPAVSGLNIAKKNTLGGGNPIFIKNESLSNKEKSYSLFNSKLIIRKFGEGAFYYLPYDFADEFLQASKENLLIIYKILSASGRNRLIKLPGESPDTVSYDPSEKQWPFSISYFLIFMLLYLIALCIVYIRCGNSKSGSGYILETFGVVLLFCILFSATAYYFSRPANSAEATIIVQPFYGQKENVYESGFYKIWPEKLSKTVFEIERSPLYHIYSTTYTNAIKGAHAGDNFKLEVQNPLAFYPIIFAVQSSRNAGQNGYPLEIDASRPPGAEHFIIKISGNIADNIKHDNNSAVLIKMPGGYFYSPFKTFNKRQSFEDRELCAFETACEKAGRQLNLSAPAAHSFYRALSFYNEKTGDASMPRFFLLNSTIENIIIKSSEEKAHSTFKPCHTLYITAAPFEISCQSGSIIPDYAIEKETVTSSGQIFTSFNFHSRYYKDKLLSGEPLNLFSLCARIRFKIPDAPYFKKSDSRTIIKNIKSSFKNNIRINSSITDPIPLKLTGKETGLKKFLNIIHDNNQNFSYNIDGGYLIINIKNLEHYLNYDLCRPESAFKFIIKRSALNFKQQPLKFDITITCK